MSERWPSYVRLVSSEGPTEQAQIDEITSDLQGWCRADEFSKKYKMKQQPIFLDKLATLNQDQLGLLWDKLLVTANSNYSEDYASFRRFMAFVHDLKCYLNQHYNHVATLDENYKRMFRIFLNSAIQSDIGYINNYIAQLKDFIHNFSDESSQVLAELFRAYGREANENRMNPYAIHVATQFSEVCTKKTVTLGGVNTLSGALVAVVAPTRVHTDNIIQFPRPNTP